jgi:hypothetical protein
MMGERGYNHGLGAGMRGLISEPGSFPEYALCGLPWKLAWHY